VRRAVSLTTVVVVTVSLLGLAAAVAFAVQAMVHANDRVAGARETLTQVNTLRQAISEEAFAEAGYRRAPGPDSWARLEDAMAAVPPLVRQVREQVDPEDGLSLSSLALLNARYEAQVRSTRGTPAAGADDRVAGPALDSMDGLLESMAGRYRGDVVAAIERQGDLTSNLRVLLLVVFALAFGVLLWVVRLNHREHRRLHHESASHRARALTDALTGLPNRDALLGAMRSALERDGRRPGVLLLDLDGFKPVNDTWGHHAGDLVLQEVARRLRGAVRSSDLAARLGGDEFAVLVSDCANAEAVAVRILAAFEVPFDVEGHQVRVGTSVGIGPDLSSQDPLAHLRAADEALYRAKAAGRARAGASRAAI
jgi:diguanylate cyclase (GGDEF)-like protein